MGANLPRMAAYRSRSYARASSDQVTAFGRRKHELSASRSAKVAKSTNFEAVAPRNRARRPLGLPIFVLLATKDLSAQWVLE